jgi:hypothetical protein
MSLEISVSDSVSVFEYKNRSENGKQDWEFSKNFKFSIKKENSQKERKV